MVQHSKRKPSSNQNAAAETDIETQWNESHVHRPKSKTHSPGRKCSNFLFSCAKGLGLDLDDSDIDTDFEEDSDSQSDSDDDDNQEKHEKKKRRHVHKKNRQYSPGHHQPYQASQHNNSSNESAFLMSAGHLNQQGFQQRVTGNAAQGNDGIMLNNDSGRQSEADLLQHGTIDREEPELNMSRRHLGEIFIRTVYIVLPLLLIVIMILHIKVIGRSADDNFASNLEEVNKVAVTLWPIMFAAIASQALKAYAYFKLERGITLINLQQYLHSTSFASTLERPLVLKRANWTSFALFCLWALSPLASQALQRIAYTTDSDTFMNQTVSYAMTGGDFSDGGFSGESKVIRDSFFGTAIISNTIVAPYPVDLWNFPRIPAIDKLSETNADGWSIVSQYDDNPTVFSSLMGTPWTNATSKTPVTDFTIITGYLSLDCDAPTMKTKTTSDLAGFSSSPSQTLWIRLRNNDTNNLAGTMEWASFNETVGVFNDSMSLDNNNMNDTMIGISYAYSSCNFENKIVQAQMSCDPEFSVFCSVIAMRPYNGSNMSDYTVSWDSSATQRFLDAVPDVLLGSVTIQELFLSDPTKIISGAVSKIGDVSKDDFTERAQMLVNTFYQVAGGGSDFTEGFSPDASNNQVFNVTGGSTVTNLVWTVSWPSMILFFICNVVILLLAIALIIFEAKTIKPGFLKFGNSIIRHNALLRKEQRHQKDNDIQGYRKMHNLSVMLQRNRKPGPKRAKVVLAPVDNDSLTLRRRRGRGEGKS